MDERFKISEAKAGDWVEGVVTRNVTVVAPNFDEEGVATAGRQECCDAVAAELRRRAIERRNRLTRQREPE